MHQMAYMACFVRWMATEKHDFSETHASVDTRSRREKVRGRHRLVKAEMCERVRTVSVSKPVVHEMQPS